MEQGTLFPVTSPPPAANVPGFSLRPDYLIPEEERVLLARINCGAWESDWRRRIQQYGLGYGASGGQPTWVRDFPHWLLQLAARVAVDADLQRCPENCVINEYIPPLGIAPHRDYPAFGPEIACVSLGSDIILDFVSADRAKRIPVFVPARSLWIIRGPARSSWWHGIAPRLTDTIDGERKARGRRVSITFRTANNAKLVPASHLESAAAIKSDSPGPPLEL